MTLDSTATAGALDLLPIELQHEVMSWLDVKSLLTFGKINKHTPSILESMTALTKVRISDSGQLNANTR
jgi:hypothetical protein